MIRILETYLARYRPAKVEEGEEPEEVDIPKDIYDRMTNALLFSAIWGIGGCLDEDSRPVFEEFFMEVINGEEVVEKHALDLGRTSREATGRTSQ
jgi:hypothetical protein